MRNPFSVLFHARDKPQASVSIAIEQEDYEKRRESLVQRYEAAAQELKKCRGEKAQRQTQEREIRVFNEKLRTQPLVLERWDAQLWTLLLDKATVFRDGRIEFCFRNGFKTSVESR